jgi:dCTP deaminase
MFLTRKAITQAVECGDIVIEPFHPENLSPNSIDVTLSENLLTYTLEGGCLDMKKENPTEHLIIPKEGMVLQPGICPTRSRRVRFAYSQYCLSWSFGI